MFLSNSICVYGGGSLVRTKQVVLTLKYNYHASVIVNFLLYVYLGAKEVGTYHI